MTSRSAWVKWVLLGVLTCGLWPPARAFIFVNEAINSTVARQVLLGGRLYADAADWKGPLGYLIYAAVLHASHFSLIALHLFALVLVALLVACVGRLAFRLGGPEAAFPAAVLAVIFLAGTLGPSLEMDLIMALLSAAAYLCLVEFLLGSAGFQACSRPPGSAGFQACVSGPPPAAGLEVCATPSRLLPLLSGLLLVLAASTKQVAGLDLAALVAALLLLRRDLATPLPARRALAPVLLGAVLGLAAVALLVARYSTFRDYLAWAWIIPAVGQHVTFLVRLQTWADLLPRFVAPVGLLWALGLVAGYQFLVERRRAPLPNLELATRDSRLLLPLWLLAGIIGLLSGSQALPYHQTQAAAPLAVLGALGLCRWLAARSAPPLLPGEGAGGEESGAGGGASARRYGRAVLAVALALTLALPLRDAAWRWRDRVLRPPDTDVSRVIAARLVPQMAPDDTLLVLAHDPSVLFWTGHRAASRYLVEEHYWGRGLEAGLPRFRSLLGPLAAPPATLLSDARAQRPKFILVPSSQPWFQLDLSVPGRQAWLQDLLTGYHAAATDPLYTEYKRDAG